MVPSIISLDYARKPAKPVVITEPWYEFAEGSAPAMDVYRKARRDAFSQSIARLQQGTAAAATTLLKTMIDPATPASVRVRAAEAIFNHAAKAIEIEDIEARVAELEKVSLAESKSGPGV